jgi:hypothetical protein
LTRRGALTQATVAGIAAIALGPAGAEAQDATPSPAPAELCPLQVAVVAGTVLAAVVPGIGGLRGQRDEELDRLAQAALQQLRDRGDVTAGEAGDLQQILDIAQGGGDEPTKVERIRAIADRIAASGRETSPAAVAIAGVVVAIARRDEASAPGAAASPAASPATEGGDGGFWDRVKEGLVGALVGAAIGGLAAGQEGAVLGAVAGGAVGLIERQPG